MSRLGLRESCIKHDNAGGFVQILRKCQTRPRPNSQIQNGLQRLIILSSSKAIAIPCLGTGVSSGARWAGYLTPWIPHHAFITLTETTPAICWESLVKHMTRTLWSRSQMISVPRAFQLTNRRSDERVSVMEDKTSHEPVIFLLVLQLRLGRKQICTQRWLDTKYHVTVFPSRK